MKRSLFMILCAAAAMTLTESTLLAQGQAPFQNVAVTAQFLQSPLYQVDGVAQAVTNARWLEIKVEFTPVLIAAKGSKLNEWMDDVAFEYEVLLPMDDKGSNYARLKGKVDYWSIPMDGKKHLADAFIHPRFIQRYAPGLKLNKSSLKNLYVKVTITAKGAVRGGQYYIPRGKSVRDAEAMFAKATQISPVEGIIFGRDKTPWVFVDLDQYELIKQGGK
jgi:hypothetical protein